MADPTTSNVLLAIPTRGSDSGTWDTPVNGDFTALDGMLGGNATIAIANSTSLTLSAPATGTVSASAGPNQSQNAVVKLTGTLTGNCSFKLTLPRIYVFDNQCTVSGFSIQIQPLSGTGTVIALPPGEKTQVAYDGTNVDFVGLARVGSYLELAVNTTQSWMSACTKQAYLPCDGATYSTALFPALGNMLGSTFGGNGITTFGLPDFRNRFALPVDQSGQGRVTNAVSGIDGTALGSVGGDQRMQAHTHTATDAGHAHSGVVTGLGAGSQLAQTGPTTVQVIGTSSVGFANITNANAGTGSSQNMPPVVVFGCRFIKT